MEITIEKSTDDNNVPYSELKLDPTDPRDGTYYITFRKYPRRVFVGVQDYRGDMSSGADLGDCWLAPVVIIEKTEKQFFDPQKAFLNALKYLGEYDPQEQYSTDYWNSLYCEVEAKIKEWQEATA